VTCKCVLFCSQLKLSHPDHVLVKRVSAAEESFDRALQSVSWAHDLNGVWSSWGIFTPYRCYCIDCDQLGKCVIGFKFYDVICFTQVSMLQKLQLISILLQVHIHHICTTFYRYYYLKQNCDCVKLLSKLMSIYDF
jgi:hypothetical protein